MTIPVDSMPTNRRFSKLRSRRMGLAAAAVLMAGAATMVSVLPASAATRLGGINVQAACDVQYEQAYAHLVEHNAFGWKCTNSFDRPVNMGWACRDQYKSASAYASYSNFNDPYSWSCFR